MVYLVTGVAGFIGFHVAQRLLKTGHEVVGVDNLNHYYDVTLKQARLQQLVGNSAFHFARIDIANRQEMDQLFNQYAIERVIHLAAQAGVRYSLEDPYAYADTNLIGYVTILENCRKHNVAHLLYASSSSVYGLNSKVPFSTSDAVDHPASFYAATKRANELIAHTYSHLFDLPTTGLRFFTVYGPWGRPDMALFKFTKAILNNNPIDIYNHGEMKRDFTYIDDVVEAIMRLQDKIPLKDSSKDATVSPASSAAPFKIFNIGVGQPVALMTYIESLEKVLGIVAQKNMLPMQPGDVTETCADTQSLFEITNYKPQTSVEEGIRHFIDWYKVFYCN